jgi:hypothetical protein
MWIPNTPPCKRVAAQILHGVLEQRLDQPLLQLHRFVQTARHA